MSLTRRLRTGGYHHQPLFASRHRSKRFSLGWLLFVVTVVGVGVAVLTWLLTYVKS